MSRSSTNQARRPSSRPWITTVMAAWAALAAPSFAGPVDRGRLPDESEPLLGDYFRKFLDERDLDAFRDRVDARYAEGELCRLATRAAGDDTRRAAVAALGLLGTFRRSNPVLGRALRDRDPIVRRMAQQALWSLWFRADTPENNRALLEVIAAARRGDLDRADALATRLIDTAPGFAEAYNQRAIIAFERGRFEDSARDCKRVLERNPYHFGALGGLTQCQMQLDRPGQALKTLRRAARLQPYDLGIQDTIRRLAAQMALGEP